MFIFSLLSLVVFLVLIAYVVRRRAAVLIAGFFLLFPLIYRSIDITYLDLFGPIYASEVNRFVGGNGAAPIFIYSALALIVPLLVLFPDSGRRLAVLARERNYYSAYHRYLSLAALIGSAIALGVLAVNFLLVGVIPILEGVDRLAYNAIAGPVHNGAYELNFLFNFILGAFTVLPRLNGRDYDLRFAAIMAALMLYWVVTGNRYSAFFVLVSFYFMPWAAVIIATRAGRIAPDGLRSFVQRALTSRVARAAGILSLTVIVVGLLFNSYFSVRNYREPLREIQERILVQPVELWSTAWERVDFGKVSDPINDHAVQEVIFNPIDATRNSTIQYLTSLELGYFRSAELTEAGQAYNGGYPEIHYEMLGAWLPLLTLPLVGLLTALFLRMCIMLLYRNMMASATMGVYIYYGITLHFAGGMVTFVMVPTYWLKIAVFLAAVIFERRVIKQSRLQAQRARAPVQDFAPRYVRP